MNFDNFIKELKEECNKERYIEEENRMLDDWSYTITQKRLVEIVDTLAQKYKDENTTAWKFDCNTDLDKLKENKEGCGKEFGEWGYYCGDYDYSDNPKIQYCPECRSQQKTEEMCAGRSQEDMLENHKTNNMATADTQTPKLFDELLLECAKNNYQKGYDNARKEILEIYNKISELQRRANFFYLDEKDLTNKKYERGQYDAYHNVLRLFKLNSQIISDNQALTGKDKKDD